MHSSEQSATAALALYRRGRTVALRKHPVEAVAAHHPEIVAKGTITGTALGMETARDGRHRKLVLYVKVRLEGGYDKIVPHYDLNPASVTK